MQNTRVPTSICYLLVAGLCSAIAVWYIPEIINNYVDHLCTYQQRSSTTRCGNVPIYWQHGSSESRTPDRCQLPGPLITYMTGELKCFEPSVLSILHVPNLVHWLAYHMWHPVICFSRWRTHHIGLYWSGNTVVLSCGLAAI